MFIKKAFAVIAAFGLPLASGDPTPSPARYAVKDHHQAPRAWRNVGRAPAAHIIDLSIGLTQSKFLELERHLFEVSDPDHVRYGQHLTTEEVHELIKPESKVSDDVHSWLAKHGVEQHHITYSPAKDWLRISLPVADVEKLLDTEYSIWEHDDGSVVVRTESWSLPHHLHDSIQAVQPTNSWARRNPLVKKAELHKREYLHMHVPTAGPGTPLNPSPFGAASACNFSAVTPDCLRRLYGTINYTPRSGGQSRMGLTNYLEEYNNRSDTRIFLEKYRPEAAKAAYEFQYVQIANGTVDDGTNHADDFTGEEGNLDAQYMLGIAWPLKLTAYTTGGRNPSFVPDLGTPTNSDEPYLTWVNYVLSQNPKDVPQVISTSYGDDEQTVSKSYATAVCRQFAQLGARGVSLLFASGDYGVGAPDTCFSNKDNTTAMFLPSFPNDCPYVTNVGGTYGIPEVASYLKFRDGSIFASGGGFSNYFDTPYYQKTIVGDYVSGLNGLHNGLYNKGGRAYPDIACVGQIFPIIWNGTTDPLLGTSGSSPICAAVLALVNDALIANGKPVLGFLNPWLYAGGYKAFTDVTNGSSIGCNTQGFPAKKGWDAVTGFGSPSFSKILQLRGVQNPGGNGGYGGGGGYY